MDIADRLLQGLQPSLASLLLLLPLSLLTLLFSMIVASRVAGGIDFSPVHSVAARAGILILAVTALNYLSWGLLLAGPVWFFGLMGLFQLSVRETRILTQISWPLMVVWKVLVLLLLS